MSEEINNIIIRKTKNRNKNEHILSIELHNIVTCYSRELIKKEDFIML